MRIWFEEVREELLVFELSCRMGKESVSTASPITGTTARTVGEEIVFSAFGFREKRVLIRNSLFACVAHSYVEDLEKLVIDLDCLALDTSWSAYCVESWSELKDDVKMKKPKSKNKRQQQAYLAPKHPRSPLGFAPHDASSR